jgi:hypothetical protein
MSNRPITHVTVLPMDSSHCKQLGVCICVCA